MKITKVDLLSGEFDSTDIKMSDIQEFVESEGIDYKPMRNKGIVKMIEELSEEVSKMGPEVTESAEKTTEEADMAIIEPAVEIQKPKASSFLSRRKAQIERAQRDVGKSAGSPKISYGDNAPEYIKRRFGGAK